MGACKGCGDELPKYKLDRYSDEACTYECRLRAERDAAIARAERAEDALRGMRRTMVTVSAEGTVASVPGSAWDIVCEDRDEWKHRASRAESKLAAYADQAGDMQLMANEQEQRAIRAERERDVDRQTAEFYIEAFNRAEADVTMFRIEYEQAEAEAERLRGLLHAEQIAEMRYCEACELGYMTPEGSVRPCPYCELARLRPVVEAARMFFSQPYDNGQWETRLRAALDEVKA